MSSPDDASSRLSNALEQIFSRGRSTGGDTPGRPAHQEPAGSSSPEPAPPQPASPPHTFPAPVPPAPSSDWNVDDDDHDDHDHDGDGDGDGDAADAGHQPGPAAPAIDTTYELPTIVPATADPMPPDVRLPPAGEPTLPHTAHVTTPAPIPATPTLAGRPAAGPWVEHRSAVPANAQGGALRAPGRRPRVRRVTRVLRHIDPWSTFKVGLLFSAVAYVVFLTAGVLLWRVADSTGTLDNVERWFTQFGWETFELKGGEIFHDAWIIGLFGVVALTGALVLLATLFNLVSDIVGGVRLTVLEEEVVERTISSTRRYVVRRPPLGADHDDAPAAWDVDGDDVEPTESIEAPTPSGSFPAAAPSATEWSVDDD